MSPFVEDESLTILDIEEGSIKIILGGSPESLKRLDELFKLGEITEVLGIPVEDLQLSEVTEEQYKSRIVKGILNKKIIGKNLSGFDLSGVELNGLDLSGFNLRDTNLSCTYLSSTNLSNANLSDADLFSTNLSSANLSNANLSSADLSSADLSNANLSSADLSSADLSGTNLNRADLSGADLSGTNLNRADLSGANLSGTNLNRTDLSGANLSDANLSRADLSNADLSNAELSRADLREVRINEATKLHNKWLLIWKIVNQKAIAQNFSNTNLTYSDFKNPNLRSVSLNGDDFSSANRRSASLNGDDFSSTNQRSAKSGLTVATYRPEISSFEYYSSDLLTRLLSGKVYTLDSRRRNGLILFKHFHAEFAGPGAAVGGDYDRDCVGLLPIGNLSLLTLETHDERQKAYLIRRQWIRLIKQITENPVPQQRVQKILAQLEQYFPPEMVAQLPDEAFAFLVGVLPQTVRGCLKRGWL